LRAVFEIKIPQVTTNPSISLFKNFQKQWCEKHTNKLERAIGEICVFIIKLYVKAWFTCPLPAKAPNQDLQFIKI